jgi:hypothetical protein
VLSIFNGVAEEQDGWTIGTMSNVEQRRDRH